MSTDVHKRTCTRNAHRGFIDNNPKGPPIRERKNTLWYVHAMKYYAARIKIQAKDKHNRDELQRPWAE